MSWASEELKRANLGDRRRNERLVKIVEDLSKQANASVPQASRDKASMEATYEFWRNVRIKASAILKAHSDQTIERVKEHEIVLAVQDTTELDFSEHRKKRGMGSLSNPVVQGLHVHTGLCVSASGVPLGLLYQYVWSREKSKKGSGYEQRRRVIAEKESQRWLDGLEMSQQQIPESVRVVMDGDREADIYDLFAHPRREGSEFLIRAAQNWNVKRDIDSREVEPLWEAVRQKVVEGELSLELQRTPRRTARSAQVSVRYGRVALQVPQNHPNREQLAEIPVYVILAEEENAPKGEQAISWMLLTTLPVENLAEASQCLKWYTFRWLIERYHYVLKSGCRIEELQLEMSDRIERALATYAIVAWRLLWLTYEARIHPDSSVASVLELHEWQALYCSIHKGSVPPEEAPSLGESVGWIAKLGGFVGRKSDGEPGVKTLWRGLQRLHDISIGWQLFQEQSE